MMYPPMSNEREFDTSEDRLHDLEMIERARSDMQSSNREANYFLLLAYESQREYLAEDWDVPALDYYLA